MEKGLFNSIFLLIMLAMFIPGVSLITKTQTMIDTKYQVEEISFAVDSIISDALSDQTTTNACSFDSKANYDRQVNTYITNFEDERKMHSSVTCTYTNLNSIINGARYAGSLSVSCFSQNDLVTISLKKLVYFDKKVIAVGGLNCNVKIEDYLNARYLQVDLNRI